MWRTCSNKRTYKNYCTFAWFELVLLCNSGVGRTMERFKKRVIRVGRGLEEFMIRIWGYKEGRWWCRRCLPLGIVWMDMDEKHRWYWLPKNSPTWPHVVLYPEWAELSGGKQLDTSTSSTPPLVNFLCSGLSNPHFFSHLFSSRLLLLPRISISHH